MTVPNFPTLRLDLITDTDLGTSALTLHTSLDMSRVLGAVSGVSGVFCGYQIQGYSIGGVLWLSDPGSNVKYSLGTGNFVEFTS